MGIAPDMNMKWAAVLFWGVICSIVGLGLYVFLTLFIPSGLRQVPCFMWVTGRTIFWWPGFGLRVF